MKINNKELAEKTWKKLNKTERRVFMNQAKNRVYYIQDLKRLFASTSQTGVEGLMGFNALQSLEKKELLKR